MIIHNVGYHHQHDSDFKIERPTGTGDLLFLLVKTDAIFLWTDRISLSRKILYGSIPSASLNITELFQKNCLKTTGFIFMGKGRRTNIPETSHSLLHPIPLETWNSTATALK